MPGTFPSLPVDGEYENKGDKGEVSERNPENLTQSLLLDSAREIDNDHDEGTCL